MIVSFENRNMKPFSSGQLQLVEAAHVFIYSVARFS